MCKNGINRRRQKSDKCEVKNRKKAKRQLKSDNTWKVKITKKKTEKNEKEERTEKRKGERLSFFSSIII